MTTVRSLLWELIEEIDKHNVPNELGTLADRCRDYLLDNPEKTHVVGIGTGIHTWGRSWLEFLLQDVDCDFHYHLASDSIPSYDRCVVITSTTEGYSYIQKLQGHNKTFGVVLLSDECLDSPLTFLEDPRCKFLARNYVHPHCLNNPKILHFGLGFKNHLEQYAEPYTPTENRKYVWSFNGSLKADREEALQAFKPYAPSHTHLVKKFNDPDYLSTQKYADVLNNSQFVLAPAGGASNDSFRIYEALECGAIPVVMAWKDPLRFAPSYWHAVFNTTKIPFIVGTTWQNAAEHVQKLLDKGQVEQKRQECVEFWRNYKNYCRSDFKSLCARLT